MTKSERQDVAFNLKKIELDKSSGIADLTIKRMKISKRTLVSLAIIIVTLAIGSYLFVTKRNSLFSKKNKSAVSLNAVQLKFGEKKYNFDYSSYSKDFVLDLAGFEKDEEWQGNKELDDTIFSEGEASLILSSKDNEKAEIYLLKKVDLSKYQFFKLAIYLQTDPSDVESTRLYFSNKDKTAYFSYPITNLVKGWNFLDIPKMKFSSTNAVKEKLIKPNITKTDSSITGNVHKGTDLLNWDGIERIGLELTARSNSASTLNFDNLIALESEDYLDDWLTGNSAFLDLVKTKDERIILQAKNVGTYLAVIKKISGVSDFTFKTKVQPAKVNARSGIFFRGDYKSGYGYFFLVDGVDGNRYQIHKTGLIDNKTATTVLKIGIINNFVVEADKPLWLKVEAKGSNLKFYLSTDNKSYTRLGEINDKEFKEGGVGITVFDGGVTLFDEFEFTQ